MKKIAFVSQKGGAGKTTLAVHVGAAAVAAGYGTCIIDIDPQASAAAWGDWRRGEDPDVITAHPPRLGKTLDDAEASGVEVAIIDTPPHADASACQAAKLADLILIPCRPRMLDLHAIQLTADMINHYGKNAFVVFNAMPHGATRLLAECAEKAAEFKLQTAPIHVSELGPYHHAIADGKVAAEIQPAGRAAQEIAALWAWACTQAGMPSRRHEHKKARSTAA